MLSSSSNVVPRLFYCRFKMKKETATLLLLVDYSLQHLTAVDVKHANYSWFDNRWDFIYNQFKYDYEI